MNLTLEEQKKSLQIAENPTKIQGTKDTGTKTDAIVETKKEVAEEDSIKLLKAIEQRCLE
jgi:hypothetical protein